MKPCDAKISRHMNGYHEAFTSMQACKDGAEKMTFKVKGYPVNRKACGSVYYNDPHLGSWYGLELMTLDSSGKLWWILTDGSLHDGS